MQNIRSRVGGRMDEELAKVYWCTAYNAVHDMRPYLYEPGGEGRAVELARQAMAALAALLRAMGEETGE